MPELTSDRITEICNEAAARAVAAFALEHPCRLNEYERGIVHTLADAITEEKANHGTLRVIVQIGKSYQDITGSIRKFGIFLLFIIVVIAGVKLGPDVWKFFR